MNMDGFSEITEIYSGYQSRIYKGIRKSDQAMVALKVPSSEFPEPLQLSALKREFQVLEALKGNGIPSSLEYIELKNSAVLVREWVEGLSLRDYQKSHMVSVMEGLAIAVQIAQRLSTVHQQNYCHRDISPSNIILNPNNGEISLLDFGSSLEFPDKARSVLKPKFIEGSRPYMSPEQTGRTNRGLDYRTDFYSLGVLFYELFTGQLPFDTKDTNELIYSHIALEPILPEQLMPALPSAISSIIMKLMSKSPDARYRSAEGVLSDLQKCILGHEQNGHIPVFDIGADDIKDRLCIPDSLYGRETQIKTLIDAFDQTSNGGGHFVFVAGHSGIGKTSLIRELYKPLTAKGGYIASGKYDQVLRHQPYSAILQAISGFVRQIISESHENIDFWKRNILKSVGANGQVLIDVIPELETLIGKQPKVAPLLTESASTRFNTTFYNFIYSLGHAGKPLVLFIDDLQWIDPPSLTLLEAMAPTLSQSTLMVVAAYRDNEVTDNHPLMITMPTLMETCKNLLSIKLEELPPAASLALLKDTLQLPELEYQEFNKLLHEKSGGNPQVYKTILATLYAQEDLYFNYSSKQWHWNRNAVHLIPRAETSVAMLQANMLKLPEHTLDLLKYAGCIGNTFSLNLLAGLSERNRAQVAQLLLPVVSQGYIQPLDDNFELLIVDDTEQLPDIAFQFVHDRVQQAAYSLLSENDFKRLHWKIGQHKLSEQPLITSDSELFDIVEHLNQGRENANHSDNKLLAQLNLKASKKAKLSAAYSVAYSCLVCAKEALLRIDENMNSELFIAVDLELAQAYYLIAKFDEAEALYHELRQRLTADTDKLTLFNLQAKQYHHQGKYQQSVECEYEALRLLGIHLPNDDESLLALFAQEKTKIETLLADTDVENLFYQNDIEDINFSLTHELLFDAFTDGYLLGRGPLLAAVAAISARISIEQGHCSIASAGYINYATVLCSSGEYQMGHTLGQLAIRLADKYQNPAFKNYTYHVFSLGINHWLEPLKSSHYYWHEASKLSLESGSPYAGWVFLQLPHVLLSSQVQLDQVEEQSQASLEYLSSNHLSDIVQLLKFIVMQPLKHLKGETDHFSSLDDDCFSTSTLLSDYQEAPFFLGHIAYSELRASLLSRNILPIETLREWLPIIENTVQAQIIQVDSCLYTGLHLAAACSALNESERAPYIEWLQELINKFDTWSALCSNNFEHKRLMLKAEHLRLQNDVLGAFECYEQAREAALSAHFLMDAALADELAGMFWKEQGKSYHAQVYLKRSLDGYEQWGAKGKVEWLKHQYPELEMPHALDSKSMRTTIESTLGAEDFSSILDMGSVVKASQAVSQHMNMEKLTAVLLNLAVENAGATRGLLLQEIDHVFHITQEIDPNSTSSEGLEDLPVPYTSTDDLSHAVVRYVINTEQPLVYVTDDGHNQFEHCTYLANHANISVLCVPIVRQSKVFGVLYLENSHLADAFQSDRVQTLNIIAAQAAISLENARMFRDLELMNNNLEELVKQRTKKLYETNEKLTDKNEELYILSTTDQLTGLYNRRYIEEQIQRALDTVQSQQPYSLLMLDIDHFKSINDSFGHDVGDNVLVNIASSIKKAIGYTSTPGRWGGEEFIVLCQSEMDEAVTTANNIVSKIAIQDNSPANTITVSIGVTPLLNGDSTDTVLKRVDQALYHAKHNGRNQVVTKTQ